MVDPLEAGAHVLANCLLISEKTLASGGCEKTNETILDTHPEAAFSPSARLSANKQLPIETYSLGWVNVKWDIVLSDWVQLSAYENRRETYRKRERERGRR